jgi:signal transduction histidine kinase
LPKTAWWLDELRDQGWLHIEDMSQVPRTLDDELYLLGGDLGRPLCAIPVYARREMIGFLGCHGLAPAGRSFNQHLQVLEVIVGILGSAWLRERVLETLDQRIAARTLELSTFFDLTTLAIGARDLSEILDAVPNRILELGSCDALCIHLLDEERTTLALAAQGNLPPGVRQPLQAIALETGFLRRLDQRSDPIVATGQADMAPVPPALHLEGFPSYLGVPLPGGWVSYYRASSQGFSLDESSLLLALAKQVGVSVENYRLSQRIEAAVTLEERGRLARDLHDSVTQSLYSLSLFARSGRDAAEEGDSDRLDASLTKLETTALQALREMRLLLYELRPQALEQEGLIRTIEQRFDAVERRAGIKATVDYQAPEGLNLPQSMERELYYLTMEALNNALKHAQASAVTVLVRLSPAEVRLEIADDGRGFDPLQVVGGYGLGDMRERAERLGGRLEISSAPGKGTRISVWVDLAEP